MVVLVLFLYVYVVDMYSSFFTKEENIENHPRNIESHVLNVEQNTVKGAIPFYTLLK